MWGTDKEDTPEVSFPSLGPMAPGRPTIARILSFTHMPFILIDNPKKEIHHPRAFPVCTDQ
jgi:hypothetical protein